LICAWEAQKKERKKKVESFQGLCTFQMLVLKVLKQDGKSGEKREGREGSRQKFYRLFRNLDVDFVFFS
jgi:hypothetical protein